MATPEPVGLAALQRRLARDLSFLNYPPPNWVATRTDSDGKPLLDVLIVGAGMCGLTAAFGLKREGVTNIRQIDAAPAGQEGPWVTYARMATLRSPKHLTGPAFGVPSLTFRAWFEAQWGEAAWEASGRIPRAQWMDYLSWYRAALNLPVENGVSVTRLAPGNRCWIAETAGGETIVARKLVLATGRDGLGGNMIPAVAASLPPALMAHTRDDIDFAALKGRRVAVLGGGASACDNAAEALEAGAAEVHQFLRRPEWPRINKFKNIVYSGFVHGFPRLTVAERLHILTYAFGVGVAPPRESILRLAKHDAYRCHLGAPWTRAEAAGGEIVIDTPKGRCTADFAIIGTGFAIDVDRVPMLAEVAPHIRRYRDGALAPDWQDQAAEYLDYPELGSAFEFKERAGRAQPMLADLHCFNQAALVGQGMVAGDIPSVADGAARLARGIARQFFIADLPAHLAALEAYEEPELLGDEIDALRYE